MNLIEKHLIKENHILYKEIDNLSFQSKNLYNSLLYIVRQEFFKTKKYIGFVKLYHSIKLEKIWNECGLPKKVCNQLVNLVDQNYRAFFQSLKTYNSNRSNFKSNPEIPNYKDSIKGRCLLIYPKDAISSLVFKKTGRIKLSNSNIYIKTQIKDFKYIKQVRVIPKNKQYQIEVVYELKEKEYKENNNFAAIDLGLNNLAVVSFNDCKNPFIINGKPLKSINQYFNKKKAKLQSKLQKGKHNSNAIIKLQNKRNNKINDYLHKASRLLVNQLVSRNISKLIIGYNKNWKQDINIGKQNNQNFTNVPFKKFILMIEYKCQIEGIKVEKVEESYTSKCSFLDNEDLCKKEEYLGKRIKRGLYKSKYGVLINADLNGSYNIMRKAFPEFKGIEGVAVHPYLFSVNR